MDLKTMHPAFLANYFVTEVGVHQAWPFLTLASDDEAADPAAVRLYVDTTFTVEPAPPGTGTGHEDDVRMWLLRLTELLNRTVESVALDADASLSLQLAGGIALHISGQSAPWTIHDNWWLGHA